MPGGGGTGGMGGGGMQGGGGHSPRLTVGAQVAGRLEEMRARELAASLRSKVQENEAMKRYLESVKVGSVLVLVLVLSWERERENERYTASCRR